MLAPGISVVSLAGVSVDLLETVTVNHTVHSNQVVTVVIAYEDGILINFLIRV
jgi:hypothetical protein